MKLRDLIETVRLRYRPLVIADEWSQDRTVFGGIVVALAHEAMLTYVPQERVLRSLSIAFVAPVATGQPLFFEIEVLREGSGITYLHCRVIQHDQTVTTLQACYGAPRQSTLALAADACFELPAIEACEPFPFLPGMTPLYLQNFDVRWGVGGMPFMGATSRRTGGWIRFRDEPEAGRLSESHLLAVIDAWPPPVLSLLKGAVPGSSLTWSIELAQPLTQLPTNTWFAMQLCSEYSEQGYSACSASVWSADGQLLALGRQTVAVFG
ncbi:acyl-CoA thioesterase [Metapseudomonas boanensis]|uniref:Thioesterase family protein n=1 Tax=Metapseudomonas boanensis TaxID=2822138 RepID=A0ABS5XG01_9GAMM|nr:thioesterase family protein [Pseudomonas boanensis]MBT8766590.1 thioesterase family protein [Pseudomonas boanensis]